MADPLVVTRGTPSVHGRWLSPAVALMSASALVFTSLWRHQDLIRQLTRRELTSRYRGSVLGVAWSFVTPLLMLAVYTFLFGVVFRSRWNASPTEGNLDYALILFVGLTVYNLFAECIGRAPTLVMANAGLVKRVIFPLEILPWTVMGTALSNAGLSLLIWIMAATAAGMPPGWTALWVPALLVPLVLFTLGCVWLLAALGVYLRDAGHAVGVAISMLLFLSPVFYRVEALPAGMQSVLRLNPLTYFIEEIRQALVWHQSPDLGSLAIALVGGWLVAAAGLACYQRARRGFADVL